MDELKEKFIKYFGEEKWNQEELLGKLHDYHMDICDVLGIEPIPVIFEDGLEDDSRFYIKEMYIALSDKITKLLEAIKCVAHECKHIEQLIRAKEPTTEQEERWHLCFYDAFFVKDYDSEYEITKYALQEIEIDAFAFTQVYIKERLGIDTYYPNEVYQEIINYYIKKYYK